MKGDLGNAKLDAQKISLFTEQHSNSSHWWRVKPLPNKKAWTACVRHINEGL